MFTIKFSSQILRRCIYAFTVITFRSCLETDEEKAEDMLRSRCCVTKVPSCVLTKWISCRLVNNSLAVRDICKVVNTSWGNKKKLKIFSKLKHWQCLFYHLCYWIVGFIISASYQGHVKRKDRLANLLIFVLKY